MYRLLFWYRTDTGYDSVKKFLICKTCLIVFATLLLVGCGSSVPFIQLGTKALYKTQSDLKDQLDEELDLTHRTPHLLVRGVV